MTEEDPRAAQPLGLRGSHIRLIYFIQDRRAIKTDIASQAAQNADHDRQDKIERGLEAPQGKESQLEGQNELPGKNPHHVVHAHENCGDEQHKSIHCPATPRGTKKTEHDPQKCSPEKDRDREAKGGTDSLAQYCCDRLLILGGESEIPPQEVPAVIHKLRIEPMVIFLFQLEDLGSPFRSLE